MDRGAPVVGQHSRDVLIEAGYDDAQIAHSYSRSMAMIEKFY